MPSSYEPRIDRPLSPWRRCIANAMSITRKNTGVNTVSRLNAGRVRRVDAGGGFMSDDKAQGWSEDFQLRLSHLIESAGGVGRAAEMVGASDDAVANWRSGKSKMPLAPAAILARAAGKTIDWLYFGDEPAEAVRLDQVQGAAADAAQFIIKAARFFGDLDPDQLAEAIGKRTAELLAKEDGGTASARDRLTHDGNG